MLSKRLGFVIVMLAGEAVLRAQTLTAPVLPGEISASVGRPEATNENALVTGLQILNDFDDNALNDNRNRQSNLLTVFEPHVGWTLSRLRTQWTLDYRPGFSVGHPISVYNSRSQLLDTRLQLTLTRRLRLRLRESFFRSKSAFDQLQQSEFTPGSSVLDRPNNSVLTATQENSEQAGADLTYALSSRSLIGASGAFYRVSYRSLLNSRELESDASTGTHAFYMRHLTKHNWVGCDYNFQELTSHQPYSRAFVQSVLYTDTFVVLPNMTVSFFAGPQRSLTSSTPRFWLNGTEKGKMQPNWSWTGGANYTWSAPRTSVMIGVSRRVSDGAGLQGIVQLSNAEAEVRRQLTRRSKGRLFVSADRNKPLVSGLAPLLYVSFGGGLSRALTRTLSLEFQYWRVHESSFAAQPRPYWADHNRLVMSLIYENKTPLKR